MWTVGNTEFQQVAATCDVEIDQVCFLHWRRIWCVLNAPPVSVLDACMRTGFRKERAREALHTQAKELREWLLRGRFVQAIKRLYWLVHRARSVFSSSVERTLHSEHQTSACHAFRGTGLHDACWTHTKLTRLLSVNAESQPLTTSLSCATRQAVVFLACCRTTACTPRTAFRALPGKLPRCFRAAWPQRNADKGRVCSSRRMKGHRRRSRATRMRAIFHS